MQKSSISNYRFSDQDISFGFASKTGVCLTFSDSEKPDDQTSLTGVLNKSDAIALARHFRLSPEDIEE